MDNKSDETEDQHEVNLGSLLQSMDYEIRQRGDDFTGEEEKFMEYFEMAVKMRKHDHVDAEDHREKMLKDKETFVEILKKRTGKND